MSIIGGLGLMVFGILIIRSPMTLVKWAFLPSQSSRFGYRLVGVGWLLFGLITIIKRPFG